MIVGHLHMDGTVAIVLSEDKGERSIKLRLDGSEHSITVWSPTIDDVSVFIRNLTEAQAWVRLTEAV